MGSYHKDTCNVIKADKIIKRGKTGEFFLIKN
jgi:hypothetical protein